MTWSAGWRSTAAGARRGSGVAGAHGVPDVRVGGEQEGHVVGDDRVGAVDLGGPAEHAGVGRGHVDHGRGARRRRRAARPRRGSTRGCRRGSRGRCGPSSGRRACPRASAPARALPATRAAGAPVVRPRVPSAFRVRGCGDHRPRLGLRRREADGAEAVIETVDAFVGQVEPFIVRLALGGARDHLSTLRLPTSADAPWKERRHRAIDAATDQRPPHATVSPSAIDCSARRRSATRVCASSMSSCRAACTWNGLRHVADHERVLVAGVDAHVARAERALHPRARAPRRRSRGCAAAPAARATNTPLRRMMRRVVIVVRRVSQARNGSRHPSSTTSTPSRDHREAAATSRAARAARRCRRPPRPRRAAPGRMSTRAWRRTRRDHALGRSCRLGGSLAARLGSYAH